ncbi:hypothetical protein DICPUDRAFT_85184 [Dictyostelium purpureum]|uniref:PPP4R2 n=1 Tax=Dictyostelium purpureum TaxID=5786 RepID=F1A4Z0_DICPU|nr:uncharacterized protein DICPUDRAFT_85184 [Dictyostelium purpureum]EGC28743.1 hypothetical protein DICPUDRAFT_85184 [Dictyostelium purpureum]|eukprot:XP_003294733.1 hypothetical protein DICPUDRAFT_85184 [Dictyostelium purpureum]
MASVDYSENLKKSLEEFSKQENKTITPELEGVIDNISKTGITCYPWNILKDLFYFKLSEILDIFEKEYLEQSNISNLPNSPQSSPSNNVNLKDEEMAKIKNQVNTSGLLKMKKDFLQNFKDSKAAPFTIQRLCELIINYQMYKSFSKYLCAVEKMLNVSSLPHLTPEEVIEYNKNKNSSRISDNENNNSEAKDIPSIDTYAFSSSFTTSFPTATTTSASENNDTDQEMKDVENEK